MKLLLVLSFLIQPLFSATTKRHHKKNADQVCAGYDCSTITTICQNADINNIHFDKLRTDIMSLLDFPSGNSNVTLFFHPCLPDCSFYKYNGVSYPVNFSSIECSLDDDDDNVTLTFPLSKASSISAKVIFPFTKLKYYPPYVVSIVVFLLLFCFLFHLEG